MANRDDYLTCYREFFENFAQTVNPNDQLPVKLASYKLVSIEVVGGIIDWTTQYLTQKKCPPSLLAPLIKIIIDEIRKACKIDPIACGFNTGDNAYEPLKLMQTVMAKTNEVCLRYLDNSMLCSLPHPGGPYFITSMHAVKNTRRRMEDRHVVIHDLNTMFDTQEASPSSYYAIFDGHAGHDAAAYSSAHLHQFLAENRYFISNPEQALLDAFCKTDALFINKCEVENLSSGTTAVVALLRPKEKTLYIAWAGDSQALLVRQGKIHQLVDPHKPSRPDERRRIEKQGGCVILYYGTWRVNGQLAVSRAIGDAEYKPYVIAIPDIQEIPLDGSEDFLILACDGLWDYLSEQRATRAVYSLIMENPDDTDRIGPHLVQLSKEEGSSDNISVIVVFLREPSKIAAEAHRANRNRTTVTMDAGLDNANNPFAISNGSNSDLISQKSDGLLLNLTDNFKQNGTENLSPSAEFFEKPNGKRSASEFDEDDEFGPETDVDAVDDALSPIEKAKGFGDVFSNNNPAEGVFNPFMEHQEKAALETERIQKQLSEDIEERRLAREETPTPPADAVHDVSGLVENAADSESEDEWNYIKGEEANKENISPPQPDKQVAEIPEEDDNMSQLNPNAAEFVPVSPTRSIPSPVCRTLLNDQVISQSPKRPVVADIDINLPNPVEFEKEVKSRPSEVGSFSNGHDSDSEHNATSPTELMENLLNGKNIDEISEFQPGSTPTKVTPSDEFHFGPNAAPFTPAKLLDQSEAALSTRAVFGDESTATLGTTFNESATSQDATAADLNLLNKESDPMSMSFYADKGDSNPFDLNEVQIIPDNIDEFLNKPDNSGLFNDTISDLPEHNPLDVEVQKNNDLSLNNDRAIQITDLDKQAYDDEKELASPLEPEKELLGGGDDIEFSKTPEPTHENLLGEENFCHMLRKPQTPDPVDSLPQDVEFISPEPREDKLAESTSPRPLSSSEIFETNSPLPHAAAGEVHDLLNAKPDNLLLRDVELISPDNLVKLSEQTSRPESTHQEMSNSPFGVGEVSDLLGAHSESPLPETTTKINDILVDQVCELPQVCDRPESKSPVCEIPVAESPIGDLRSKSPVYDLSESKSPVCELPEAKSPDCYITESKSPIPDQYARRKEEEELMPSPQEIDFTKVELIEQAQQHFEDICKPTEDRVVSKTPEEDVTSSLKDEDVPSPVSNQIIDDSFVADQSSLVSDIAQTVADVVQETATSPLLEEPIMDFISSPKSIADTESVTTTDANSFDRSLPLEVSSPLSATEQEMDNMKKCFYPVSFSQSSSAQGIPGFDLSHQLSALSTFSEEQIDIKTENIAPEFAEQAVITPSEESKQDDVPTAPLLEEVVKEPLVEAVKASGEQNEVAPVVAAVVGVATATAVAASVATKSDEKKKLGAAAPPTKKSPTPKSATSKPAAKSTSAPPKPATRIGASRVPPAKTGNAKPLPTTATSRQPAAAKLSPKPKTTTAAAAAPKPTERKPPLTNGELKPAVRSTLTSRRVLDSSATKTTTTTTASRPATAGAAKLSPTKSAPRPAAAARPATAPQKPFTSTRLTTTTNTNLAPKPRPTTLANRSSPSLATKAAAATAKAAPITKSSPRTLSATAPKPRPPVSTTLSKPRVPLTRTVGKAAPPDTEKQNKESANKLTASRNITRTVGGPAAARTTSSTLRKVENKTTTTGSRTIVSKTSTTTMKSTTAKKPTEIVRSSKTKTTKLEKPKENGLSTVVTEEITVTVNNISSVIDSEPPLVKDNSPVDNKLMFESTLIDTTTTTAAD